MSPWGSKMIRSAGLRQGIRGSALWNDDVVDAGSVGIRGTARDGGGASELIVGKGGAKR